MADIKLTALPLATTVANADLIYLVKDPTTAPVSQKATVQQLLSLAAPPLPTDALGKVLISQGAGVQPVFSEFLALGPLPTAVTGSIRLNATGSIWARNTANTADIRILRLNGDTVTWGVPAYPVVISGSTVAFNVTPTAPTAPPGTNDTQLATTAFVKLAAPVLNQTFVTAVNERATAPNSYRLTASDGLYIATEGSDIIVRANSVKPDPHQATHQIGGTDVLLNNAWTNQANTFTQNQLIQKNDPGLILWDQAQPANLRVWKIYNSAQSLFFQTLDDGGSQSYARVYIDLTGQIGGALLDASALNRGTVPDARLSVNVLKHTGGYPGGTTTFLNAAGAFTTPVAVAGAHAATHGYLGSDPILHLQSQVAIRGDYGQLYFDASSAPAGQKRWRFVNYLNGELVLEGIGDADNVSTAGHTFSRSGGFTVHGSAGPQLQLFDQAQPVDSRRFRIQNSSQSLSFYATNDAITANAGYCRLDRLGNWTASGGLASGTSVAVGTFVQMNGAAGNHIQWSAGGIAPPAYDARSVGTKLMLYPNIGPGTADYAIGIESNTLWFGAPTLSSEMKWYGGTSMQMRLTNNQLVVSGKLTSAGAAFSGRVTVGPAPGLPEAPMTYAQFDIVSPGGHPALTLTDLGQPADARRARHLYYSQKHQFDFVNDAENAMMGGLVTIDRGGSIVASGNITANSSLRSVGDLYNNTGSYRAAGDGLGLVMGSTGGFQTFSDTWYWTNKANTFHRMLLDSNSLLSVYGGINASGAMNSASLGTGAIVCTTINTQSSAIYSGAHHPNTTAAHNLGDPSLKWAGICLNLTGLAAATGVVTGADGWLYYNSSTRADKRDIEPLSLEYAKAVVSRLVPFRYRDIKDESNGPKVVGFMVEDNLDNGNEELVTYYNDKPASLLYDRIAVYLTSVVQDMQRRIDELEARLN